MKRNASSFPCIAFRHEYHHVSGAFATARIHGSSDGRKYAVLLQTVLLRSIPHWARQVISGYMIFGRSKSAQYAHERSSHQYRPLSCRLISASRNGLKCSEMLG